MKKLLKKINQAVTIIVLYSFSFPCFGGGFSWEIAGIESSAYAEHLEWQKNFQWNRTQAFQVYKRQYRHYLRQRKIRLWKRLHNQDRDRMEKQQSELKKEWDAEQKAYQITRLRITKEYISTRNRHRKKKIFRKYPPKKTKYSREFVL